MMSSPSPVCNKESDFEGHAAIDSAFVGDSTQQFCTSIAANDDVTPDSAAVTKTYQSESFVNYVFEVQWIDGCDSVDSQPPTVTADGGWSCEGLLKETYFGCNNGGVGGYIDDRCLRYSFTGGMGDEAPPLGGQSPDESPADSEVDEPEGSEDDNGNDASDSQDEPEDTSDDDNEEEDDQGPETTITPLEMRGTGCWNEEDHEHTDVHKKTVKDGAQLACIAAPSVMTPDDANYVDSLGNVIFEVGWIPGCETDSNSQSVNDPLGDGSQTCENIFLTTWESCNNNGVGGYIEAGCLTYWVTGSVETF